MTISMSDQLKEIGKRIREIRLSKKMSQEEVAYKAKTSVCNISDIELGKTNYRIETFMGILEALQASADYILLADAPNANEIYKKELANILNDCTPNESESILRIIKEIKATCRNN